MDYGYSNLLDAFSSRRNLTPGFLDDPLLELPREMEKRGNERDRFLRDGVEMRECG